VHDVDPEDLAAVHIAAKRLADVAKPVLGADGFNIIQSTGPAAWQTVFHLHVHVIPRYADDPLRLPWVPAPGDPDEIQAAGAQLKEALA
jgi:histidine triad (HIT) family protein